MRFRNLLSEFAHDRIVVISTHIVSDVEYIATQNAVMKSGKIIQTGTTEELVKHVSGKVWSCRVPAGEAARWEREAQVVSLRNEPDGTVALRYLAEEKITEGSRRVKPRLEDLYLWLFPQESGVAR